MDSTDEGSGDDDIDALFRVRPPTAETADRDPFFLVWRRFVGTVGPRVLADRAERPGESRAKAITAGRAIDTTIPRLLTVSGKGGWHRDDARREHQAGWSNITLLDHLLSVARGAGKLAALCLGDDARNDRPILALCTAIGFLHDVDKAHGSDGKTLTAAMVGDFARTYGLDRFLAGLDLTLGDDALLALVQSTEARTAATDGAFGTVDPRQRHYVRECVRAADLLDGAALHHADGGTAADRVYELWGKLNKPDDGLLTKHRLDGWRPLTIDLPQLPMLVEHAQTSLERACIGLAGIEPLFSSAMDGRLHMLLPLPHAKSIIEKGLDEAAAGLPFEPSLIVGSQGLPLKLAGSTVDWPRFKEVVAEASSTKGALRLSEVKVADFRAVGRRLHDAFAAAGLPAASPEKTSGNAALLAPAEPGSPEARTAATFLQLSAALSLEVGAKTAAPPVEERVAALATRCGGMPDWAAGLDTLTRRTLVAALATRAVAADPELDESLLGPNGLLAGWYGRCVAGRDDKAPRIREAVRTRLEAIALGHLDAVTDFPGAVGCVVTGEPVDPREAISQADGLYGLKSSAMSYRRGRPESRFSEKAHTVVGPLAYAELRLRGALNPGDESGNMPITLFCPPTMGLFGGYMVEDKPLPLSSYDVLRADLTKDARVFRGGETWVRRVLVSRFEEYPATLAKRLGFVRRLLETTQRVGRPMHLFRGLPEPRPEFFWFDAADPEIQAMLGGRGLRLEQIPGALTRLRIAEMIVEHPGLGGAVLKRYASPRPFGAAAESWWVLRRSKKSGAAEIADRIHDEMTTMETRMNKDEPMSGPVRLGRMAATIQPPPSIGSANSRITRLIRIACDSATESWKRGMHDRTTIVTAIGGKIHADLQRGRSRFSASWRRPGQTLTEAIQAFAEVFHDTVWLETFNGRPPVTAAMRTVTAAYAWSFLTAPKAKAPEGEKTDQEFEDDDDEADASQDAA